MTDQNDHDGVDGLDKKERKDAKRRAAPKAAVVYEAIRQEGEEELGRNTETLIWSGLAAGLSMGFSFLMEALLAGYLPEASWTPLVSKFGYCIGFIIVVLGRQQLFTENTLTPILHLLQHATRRTFLDVARLWTAVLLANLAGALVFAMLLHAMGYFQGELNAELAPIGLKVFASSFWATLLSGLFAGWLIALMVWLLPFAGTGRVTIIILITYLIGLGGFSHIIAGSVSAFYILFAGVVGFPAFLWQFFIPTLLGNIVGGVAFVAAINHAQVSPNSMTSIRGSHPQKPVIG